MKNLINYYYNLYPENIYKKENYYYFFINNIKYYIISFSRPIEDLEILVKISNSLINTKQKSYIFLNTIENKYFINQEEKIFVLLKTMIKEDQILDLIDILNFNKLLKSNQTTILNRENWVDLWSSKIDYFEYQISQMGVNYKIILNSFSYYVAIAENAISYAKNTFIEENMENEILSLAHKRINYPVKSEYIYNPLNFVFDYEVRDIAEYIKTMFFKEELIWDEIEVVIQNKHYSKAMLRLLYARLLYPSYYFDLYEKVINKEINEKELLKIITKSKEYEEFLFDIYNIIKKQAPIPEIEWLMR